ncbi:MAG: hypothetical protein NTV22_15985 [bacterium]|nr:hypothetical protein [bacterium]
MVRQALRAVVKKGAQHVIVQVEAAAPHGKWQPVLTLAPQAVLCAADTLALDVFTPTLQWQTAKTSKRRVTLSGGDGIARIVTTITTHSHDMLRVETRVTLRRPMRITRICDRLCLQGLTPARIWLPQLAPDAHSVASDLCMRMPAAIVDAGSCTLALIANPRMMATHRRMPLAVACQYATAEISFGFMAHRLEHDALATQDETDNCDELGVMRYSYYLYYDDQPRRRDGVRRVVHRLWRLCAEAAAGSVAPQRIVLEQYSEHLAHYLQSCAQPVVDAVGDDLFSVTPVPAGDAAPLQPVAAVALGMAAQRLRHKGMLGAARAAVDALVRQPQPQGLWRTAGATAPADAAADLADLSWQAYWLCRWHAAIESHPAALAFVEHYVQRLLQTQKHGGHMPALIDPATNHAARHCAKGAATALHVLLLCQYHAIAGDAAALHAARRAGNALIRDVVRARAWQMHDLPPLLRRCAARLPRTVDRPAYALAMWWAAQALLELYQRTKTERFLSYGTRALDELLTLQQVWDPPFVPMPCFGGFGAATCDTRWNTAPQALFAVTLCAYYDATGVAEYFTRGIAALRAACGMVNCLENTIITPLAADQPRGWTPAAAQLTQPHAPMTTLARAPVAYEPAALVLCGRELLWRAYADVYVDTQRGMAFGINGVVIERVQRDLAGHAVYGREALGVPRTITARTSSGTVLTLALKANAAFEFQV